MEILGTIPRLHGRRIWSVKLTPWSWETVWAFLGKWQPWRITRSDEFGQTMMVHAVSTRCLEQLLTVDFTKPTRDFSCGSRSVTLQKTFDAMPETVGVEYYAG